MPRRLAVALAVAIAPVVAACSTAPGALPPPTDQAAAVAGDPSSPAATDPPSATPTATPTPAPTTSRPTPVDRRTRQAPRPAPHRAVPRGTVVVLDAGHNGLNGAYPAITNRLVPAGYGQLKPCNTTGTASLSGYPEHAFNWDVTLRARAILARHGITVLLTRSSDDGVGPCVNVRGEFGNAHHATLMVAVHADGHSGGNGFHVIEASRPPAGSAVAAASHRLAVAVHDRYLAGSGFGPATYIGSGGYARRGDLAGLNLSLVPTIFIECGNMRDAGDAARMQAAAGRQRAAQAIADGILAYLAR